LVKKNKDIVDNVDFPNIHPILIMCALELFNTYIKDTDDLLTIITPCKCLVQYGNNINLKNVSFIEWNVFYKNENLNIHFNKLENSPIPPGFFEHLGIATQSAVTMNEIENVMKNKLYEKNKIIEMLACDQGCHNGDGVMF
jgi:hypothetical protein